MNLQLLHSACATHSRRLDSHFSQIRHQGYVWADRTYSKVKLRIRFSLDNLKLDTDVLNIPLFLADQTDRLIGLALEEKEHRIHSS